MCSYRPVKSWIFLLCLLVSNFVFATQASSHVELENLAQQRQWLQLLGFNQAAVSAIQTPDFFLSSTGAEDPLAELSATIHQMLTSESLSDDHPVCRFRGRYYWLVKQGILSEQEFAHISCKEFLKFSGLNTETRDQYSFSLVFATGYLGNPASYYGHLLIKLDQQDDLYSRSTLQEPAINYGAKVPDNENMALYVIRGLVGSYDSTFTSKEFYFHLHHYANAELRDLWQYTITLDKEGYQLFVGHLWEMQNVNHAYYFANRNCAYRVAEIIELVTDNSLVSHHKPWVTPQGVVQALSTATRRLNPLPVSVKFYPSRQSQLHNKYQQLSRAEASAVNRYILEEDHAALDTFELDETAKKRVLDTVMDYYRMIYAGESVANQPEYHKALQSRFHLPAGASEFDTLPMNRPDKGHSPSYGSVGSVVTEGGEVSVALQMRPVYYDNLDAGIGHIKGSSLSMMEGLLYVNDSDVIIKRLDLLKIENAHTYNTGLPGDENEAWALNVGFEQFENGCTNCFAYKASARRGVTGSLYSAHLTGIAMAGIGVLGESSIQDALFAEATFKLLWYPLSRFSTSAEVIHRNFLNTDHSQDVYRLTQRYKINSKFDLRLFIDKTHMTEIGVSLGYYW